MCTWKCGTLWLTRLLMATNVPSASIPCMTAWERSRTLLKTAPISESGRSKSVSMWLFTMNSEWPAKSGRWSRKASEISSSKTLKQGTLPRTILQKVQFSLSTSLKTGAFFNVFFTWGSVRHGIAGYGSGGRPQNESAANRAGVRQNRTHYARPDRGEIHERCGGKRANCEAPGRLLRTHNRPGSRNRNRFSFRRARPCGRSAGDYCDPRINGPEVSQRRHPKSADGRTLENCLGKRPEISPSKRRYGRSPIRTVAGDGKP